MFRGSADDGNRTHGAEVGQETPEGLRCDTVSRGRSGSVVGRALLAVPGRILLQRHRQFSRAAGMNRTNGSVCVSVCACTCEPLLMHAISIVELNEVIVALIVNSEPAFTKVIPVITLEVGKKY